jgi:homoserine dehydrogenase
MAVEPLLLPTWHLLASVEEEYNAVYLRCASSGDLSLFGKGAGALPTATALLGDLIDLAQDNSVRWPVPQALPLARAGAEVEPPARRHYLRVTGPPHPGLDRRVESLVRRLGLTVQNRASRGSGERTHLAFMISPSTEALVGEVATAIRRLARVEQLISLGVLD